MTDQMDEDVQIRHRPLSRPHIGDIASVMDSRASASVPQVRLPMPDSKELELRFMKVLVSVIQSNFLLQILEMFSTHSQVFVDIGTIY